MNRRLKAGWVLVLCLGLAIGCLTTQGAERSEVVEIWMPMSVEEQLDFDAFAVFEREFGIPVEWVIMPFYDLRERLITAVAAGEAPDIVALDANAVAGLVNAGALREISRELGFVPRYSSPFLLEDGLYAYPIPVTSYAWVFPRNGKAGSEGLKVANFYYDYIFSYAMERAVQVELIGHVVTPENPEEAVVEGVPGFLLVYPIRPGVVGMAYSFEYPAERPFERMSGPAPVIGNHVYVEEYGIEISGLDISHNGDGTFISLRLDEEGNGVLRLATASGVSRYSFGGGVKEPVERLGIVEERYVEISVREDWKLDLEYHIPKVTVHYPYEFPQYCLKGLRITYGLVHEVFFDAANAEPENIPAVMQDCDGIMIGVIVDAPTAADIKSDLVFYNKDNYLWYYPWYWHCWGFGIERDLLAYEIDTHGIPLVGSDWQPVTGADIAGLWYSAPFWGANVHMDDAIILADACNSLNDSLATAKAFVDSGRANAYVGTTVSVPVPMDAFTEEFWDSLSYDGQTVAEAEYDAETARGLPHSYFDVYGSKLTRCSTL